MLLLKFQSNSGRNGVEDLRLFLLIGLGHARTSSSPSFYWCKVINLTILGNDMKGTNLDGIRV